MSDRDEEHLPPLIQYQANPFTNRGMPWSWDEAEQRYKELQEEVDEFHADILIRQIAGRKRYITPTPYGHWFKTFEAAVIAVIKYFYPKYNGVDCKLLQFRDLARKIPFIGTLEVRLLDHSNLRLSGCQALHELLYNIGKGGNYYRWADEFIIMFDEVAHIIGTWKNKSIIPSSWEQLQSDKELWRKEMRFAWKCNLVEDMVRGYGRWAFNPDFVVDKRLGGETRAYEDMTDMVHSLPSNHKFVKTEYHDGYYPSTVRCPKRHRM